MIKSIAVIGNGCAAIEKTKAIREKGYDNDIHLFPHSISLTYNSMLVTCYISGKIYFKMKFSYG